MPGYTSDENAKFRVVLYRVLLPLVIIVGMLLTMVILVHQGKLRPDEGIGNGQNRLISTEAGKSQGYEIVTAVTARGSHLKLVVDEKGLLESP